MSRLKDFRNWILVVIAFYLFSCAITYIYFHGEELGLKIYNLTHKEEIVNVVETNTY